MSTPIPSEITTWAINAEPGSTMVDETGQKWYRGDSEENAQARGNDSPGDRLLQAANKAAAAGETQGVVFSRIYLKRVND
jgi:hypothetical protein